MERVAGLEEASARTDGIDMSDAQEQPKARRRLPRFSLITLIVVVNIAGIYLWLAWDRLSPPKEAFRGREPKHSAESAALTFIRDIKANKFAVTPPTLFMDSQLPDGEKASTIEDEYDAPDKSDGW